MGLFLVCILMTFSQVGSVGGVLAALYNGRK